MALEDIFLNIYIALRTLWVLAYSQFLLLWRFVFFCIWHPSQVPVAFTQGVVGRVQTFVGRGGARRCSENHKEIAWNWSLGEAPNGNVWASNMVVVLDLARGEHEVSLCVCAAREPDTYSYRYYSSRAARGGVTSGPATGDECETYLDDSPKRIEEFSPSNVILPLLGRRGCQPLKELLGIPPLCVQY